MRKIEDNIVVELSRKELKLITVGLVLLEDYVENNLVPKAENNQIDDMRDITLIEQRFDLENLLEYIDNII